jgi:hypothetical protein
MIHKGVCGNKFLYYWIVTVFCTKIKIYMSLALGITLMHASVGLGHVETIHGVAAVHASPVPAQISLVSYEKNYIKLFCSRRGESAGVRLTSQPGVNPKKITLIAVAVTNDGQEHFIVKINFSKIAGTSFRFDGSPEYLSSDSRIYFRLYVFTQNNGQMELVDNPKDYIAYKEIPSHFCTPSLQYGLLQLTRTVPLTKGQKVALSTFFGLIAVVSLVWLGLSVCDHFERKGDNSWNKWGSERKKDEIVDAWNKELETIFTIEQLKDKQKSDVENKEYIDRALLNQEATLMFMKKGNESRYKKEIQENLLLKEKLRKELGSYIAGVLIDRAPQQITIFSTDERKRAGKCHKKYCMLALDFYSNLLKNVIDA